MVRAAFLLQCHLILKAALGQKASYGHYCESSFELAKDRYTNQNTQRVPASQEYGPLARTDGSACVPARRTLAAARKWRMHQQGHISFSVSSGIS